MFEGDLTEGELEIGQVSGGIDKIQSVKEVVDEIVSEYNATIKSIENTYL
jgi:enoyl-[acyl-carrier protein] reductase II